MDYKDFIEFRKGEYEDRLNKLKREMSNKNLDAVILTDEENIRWATGYWTFLQQDKWVHTVVIIPYSDKGEPVLLISAEAFGERLSIIKKVKYLDRRMEPPFDEILNAGEVIIDTMRELGLENSKIGMELGRGMRVNMEQRIIEDLKNSIPGIKLVDISDSLWRIRSIKSPAEIEKLRKASKITSDSYREAFKILREGITERELSQFFIKYWFEHGATGIGHIGIGFGDENIYYVHNDPKEYPLEKGQMVKVDAGCSFEGYRCDMYRMACVGKPSSENMKATQIVKRANREIIKNIREGIRCSDIFRVGAKVFEEAGIENLIPPHQSYYMGHGIGLAIHELPYIQRSSNYILKSGMVLSIEPWIMKEDLTLCMNVEDMVLVKKDGHEVLTDMERDIYIV